MLRWSLLAGVLGLIHAIYVRQTERWKNSALSQEVASGLLSSFAKGARLAELGSDDRWIVESESGELLGHIAQTSPQSDPFVGFSGPTNVLIALDAAGKLLKAELQSSRDTRDHVLLVQKDSGFWNQWQGLDSKQIQSLHDYQAVAGATLTSAAIVQGLQRRLGAKLTIAKFAEPVEVESVRTWFASVHSVVQDRELVSLWHVLDSAGREIGWLLRTSPAADQIVGYQGPTDALLAFAPDGSIVGMRIGKSFDNQPYVGYAQQDTWFASVWEKYRWPSVAELDLKEAGVEGVSGATMTSMAVAESLVATAKAYQKELEERAETRSEWPRALSNNAGTIAVTLIVSLFALSSWRGNRVLRWMVQIVVIVYLGFIQGSVLSIAMWVGWVQHGVPVTASLGLVVLSIAAIVLVTATRRNVYCSHLCPYGAVQQILPRKWKRSAPYPRWLRWGLRAIRPVLWVWVFGIVVLGIAGSLVDLEPFDAFVWEVAAIPSLMIALAGIVLSLWIPMGYCNHGCLTGSVLQYLRPVSHRFGWSSGDWVATLFLLLGLAAYLAS